MPDQPPCVLAVDVGTSSLKAVVYSDLGAVLASASRRYPLPAPLAQPAWAEANPHDWWQALTENGRPARRP